MTTAETVNETGNETARLKLLTNSKPECYDFLWNHFVFGLDYADIAADRNMSYDNVRMKIGRCLEAAKSLVA